MKGMVTCKVCERDFPLMAEEHYVVRDPQRVGVLANLANTDKAMKYDAFDCPHCGCQNVMQGRKPVYLGEDTCPCNYGICDECDHQGKYKDPNPGFDSCHDCKFADKRENEELCSKCKHCYPDYFKSKEEENE